MTTIDPADMPASELHTRLGIVVTEASAQRVVATMPVAGNTQPAGLLHGGATAAIAEGVGSIGAIIHAGPGRSAVGVELSVTHHRSAREGTVTAVATPLHLGSTVATYEIAVTDDTGRRTATARLTCLLRHGRADLTSHSSTGGADTAVTSRKGNSACISSEVDD